MDRDSVKSSSTTIKSFLNSKTLWVVVFLVVFLSVYLVISTYKPSAPTTKQILYNLKSPGLIVAEKLQEKNEDNDTENITEWIINDDIVNNFVLDESTRHVMFVKDDHIKILVNNYSIRLIKNGKWKDPKYEEITKPK